MSAPITISTIATRSVNKDLWSASAIDLALSGNSPATYGSVNITDPAFETLIAAMNLTSLVYSGGVTSRFDEVVIGYTGLTASGVLNGYNCVDGSVLGGVCCPDAPFTYDHFNITLKLCTDTGMRLDIIANVQLDSPAWKDQLNWKIAQAHPSHVIFGMESMEQPMDYIWNNNDTGTGALAYTAKIITQMIALQAANPDIKFYLDTASLMNVLPRYTNWNTDLTGYSSDGMHQNFNATDLSISFISDFNINLDFINIAFGANAPSLVTNFMSTFSSKKLGIWEWGKLDTITGTVLGALYLAKFMKFMLDTNYYNSDIISIACYQPLKTALYATEYNAMVAIGNLFTGTPEYCTVTTTYPAAVQAVAVRDGDNYRLMITNEGASTYTASSVQIGTVTYSTAFIRSTWYGGALNSGTLTSEGITEDVITIRPYSINIIERNAPTPVEDLTYTLRDYSVSIPSAVIHGSYPIYIVMFNDVQINELCNNSTDITDFMTRNGFTKTILSGDWVYTITATELRYDQLTISATIGDGGATQYRFTRLSSTVLTRPVVSTVDMTDSSSAYKTIIPQLYSASMLDAGFITGLVERDILGEPFQTRVRQLRFTQYDFTQPTHSHYTHVPMVEGTGLGLNLDPTEISDDGNDPTTFLDGASLATWTIDQISKYAAFSAGYGLPINWFENMVWGSQAEVVRLMGFYSVERINHGIETNLGTFTTLHFPAGGTDYVALLDTNIPVYQGINPDYIPVINTAPVSSVVGYQVAWNAAIAAKNYAAPFELRVYTHGDESSSPDSVVWDTVTYENNIPKMATFFSTGLRNMISAFTSFPGFTLMNVNINQWAIASADTVDSPRYTYLECMFNCWYINTLLTLNRDVFAGKIKQAVYDTVKKTISNTNALANTKVNYYSFQQAGLLFPQVGESSVLNDATLTGLSGCIVTTVIREGIKYFWILNTTPVSKNIDGLTYNSLPLTDGVVYLIYSSDLKSATTNFKIGRLDASLVIPGYGIALVSFTT